jgi:hypothetical protein
MLIEVSKKSSAFLFRAKQSSWTELWETQIDICQSTRRNISEGKKNVAKTGGRISNLARKICVCDINSTSL